MVEISTLFEGYHDSAGPRREILASRIQNVDLRQTRSNEVAVASDCQGLDIYDVSSGTLSWSQKFNSFTDSPYQINSLICGIAPNHIHLSCPFDLPKALR